MRSPVRASILPDYILAHRDASLRRTDWVAIEGIADMPAASRTSGCDATDPKRRLGLTTSRIAASPDLILANAVCCTRRRGCVAAGGACYAEK